MRRIYSPLPFISLSLCSYSNPQAATFFFFFFPFPASLSFLFPRNITPFDERVTISLPPCTVPHTTYVKKKMPSSMYSDHDPHHHRRSHYGQQRRRRQPQHSPPPPSPLPRHHNHQNEDTQSCCSSSSACSSEKHAVIIHPRSKEINRDRYALVQEQRAYYDEDDEGPEEYVVNPGHRYQGRGGRGPGYYRDRSVDSYGSERERRYRRRKKEKGLLVAVVMFVAGVVLCFVD
ncbi:hypothetical protein QBC38DRAFT_180322 [Podospora fimiseda]|uniref:Uncharacterized protein n=1 Tax=Podospora fimiseda TaxID=252190 RepID=A0AAN7BQQ6_9PEZI|nr:hypothetical protein QBC38DRAFT_180322 [Podospora fimiseda]